MVVKLVSEKLIVNKIQELLTEVHKVDQSFKERFIKIELRLLKLEQRLHDVELNKGCKCASTKSSWFD